MTKPWTNPFKNISIFWTFLKLHFFNPKSILFYPEYQEMVYSDLISHKIPLIKSSIFSSFSFFRQYRPRKFLLRYSRTNKRLSRLQKHEVQKVEKLTFFQRGEPGFIGLLSGNQTFIFYLGGGSCNFQPSFGGGSVIFLSRVGCGSCVFYRQNFQMQQPTPPPPILFDQPLHPFEKMSIFRLFELLVFIL